MKNTHIKAGQEVPIELRKEIYREALEVVKKEDYSKFGFDLCFSLCLGLPCLLWDIDLKEKSLIRQTGLDYRYTYLMFPELKSFLSKGIDRNYTDKERIEFLKSVI